MCKNVFHSSIWAMKGGKQRLKHMVEAVTGSKGVEYTPSELYKKNARAHKRYQCSATQV